VRAKRNDKPASATNTHSAIPQVTEILRTSQRYTPATEHLPSTFQTRKNASFGVSQLSTKPLTLGIFVMKMK
jgi:hypothetical protein